MNELDLYHEATGFAIVPAAPIEIVPKSPESSWELEAPAKSIEVKKSNLQTLEWFTFKEKLPEGDCEILAYLDQRKGIPGMGPKFVITRPDIAKPVSEFYLRWCYLI